MFEYRCFSPLEFVDDDSPSVIVRTAVTAPVECTSQNLRDLVPIFQSFSLNDHAWTNPKLDHDDQVFAARSGMGIEVKIYPDKDIPTDQGDDRVSMIQKKHSAKICQWLPSRLMKQPCAATKMAMHKLVTAKPEGDWLCYRQT